MTRDEKVAKDLKDIIVWMKYAQYRPDLERRETFDEIVTLLREIKEEEDL